MSIGLATFTIVHVIVSLIGIGSGFIVLRGFMRGAQNATWTTVFLTSTIATSVTGFGFPFVQLLPAHVLGVISLIALALAVFARSRRLAGSWRLIFVLSCVTALYLNCFVAVAQLFRRVPWLHALAPTESEPPFLGAEVALLIVFVGLGAVAVRGFKAGAALPATTTA